MMTEENVKEIVNKIDLSSFPIHLQLATKLTPGSASSMLVSAGVESLDADAPKGSTDAKKGFWPPHSVSIDLSSELTPDMVVDAARQAVLKALNHEVEEHLQIDGVRWTNPHPMLACTAPGVPIEEGNKPAVPVS